MSSEEKLEEDQEALNNTNKQERIWHICELSACLSLFFVALVVEFAAMPQYAREIPVQEITGSGNNNADSTYVRNLTFDHAYKDETMGTVTLACVGLLLPFLVQLSMALFRASRQPYDVYNTLCSYLLSISATFLIVDILKLYCGYLRPHFYGMCQPDETYDYCTNTDESELRGIRDSFPSGHAALSMAGLGSLSMFIYHRLGMGCVPKEEANGATHRVARLWSIVAMFPLLLSLFIGASRVRDDYHHPADVVGGFVVGGVVAYFCHHLYFLA